MKKYYATHLVKSEDLNHHGTLFAARTASWMVEAAFIAAACTHGNPSEIVCRKIHSMDFRQPAQNGTVIRFASSIVYTGKSSITVYVGIEEEITGLKKAEGYLTFVTINNETGKAVAHGIDLDEPADDEERCLRETARKLRA